MGLNNFKSLVLILFLLAISISVFAQTEAVIIPSNRSTGSLEKNILFYADQRYSVSQTGSVSMLLPALFDGNYQPFYSEPLDENNPLVILIENLPNFHVQAGAWIGWSTRAWNPTRFKIEAYNIYDGANTWVTIANEENY